MDAVVQKIIDLKVEIEALESDPDYEASVKLKNVIKLAKKWNDSPTEYNRTQFLVEFNSMREVDQDKAVAKGSELSSILIGWCSEARLEFEQFES